MTELDLTRRSEVTMKTAIALLALFSVALAAPIQEEIAEKPTASIIKQINQVNLDGTYTFGYEADDGSFKVETRDALGNVVGKFGFIDHDGTPRVLEYKAGNGTGFKANSDYLPVPLVPVQIPAVTSSAEQRALDELYQSVDDNQDGIPDAPRQRVLAPVSALPAAPVVTVLHTQPKQVTQTVAVPASPSFRVVESAQPVTVPVFQKFQPVQRVTIPATSVALGTSPFQVITGEPSQRELDEQFQSVDDDEDGIPDVPRVRVAIPAIPAAVPASVFQTAVPVNTQATQIPSFRPITVAGSPAVPLFGQPLIRQPAVPNFEQLIRDLQFQSVDANEDGIPDTPGFIRLV